MSDHDETIDDAESRALSRALRDVPPATPATERDHLAQALAAFNDAVSSSNVVSLGARRARFQPRFDAAAAALLVVGGFAGWTSRGNGQSGDDSSDQTVVRNTVRPCISYEGDYLGEVDVRGVSYALFLKKSSNTLDVVLLDPVTCAVPTTQP